MIFLKNASILLETAIETCPIYLCADDNDKL